ncbi:MAG: DNA repair protein RecO [Eubacteriales bacterium]
MPEDIEVDGLVIQAVTTGEADKVITLLTAKYGRITITGKGIGSMRNRHAASAQLFSYSTFLLHRRGNYWYIRDTYFIECFMNIRYDVEKLALANYVCDVARDFALENVEDPDLLSLTLNTLYAIANRDKIPLEQIRGAFEFRAAVQGGFMPDLSGCGVCGCDEEAEYSLDVMNGRILCRKCRTLVENDPEFLADTSAKIFIRLSYPVLCALRYIEAAGTKKFLSFTLDKQELSLFSVICERYLLNHLEHGFSSLEYYKKIRL